MKEKITGLQSLPNGKTYILPADGALDNLIAKYGKRGDNIKRSKDSGLDAMLDFIYTSAKKDSGLGMREASKDVADIIKAATIESLTVSTLTIASEHGDTANAISLANKMPFKELAKYDGSDRAIVTVKNKRAETAEITDSVQTKSPQSAEGYKRYL